MRTGRPPKAAEDKRTANIQIRTTKIEKERFVGYAERHNLSYADTLMLGLDMLESEEKKNEDC